MSALLFDSDFIVALLFHQESTHGLAAERYRRADITEEYVLPYVHYEALTVCSRKYGAQCAKQAHAFILQRLRRVAVAELEEVIWQEFFSYSKKAISFVDCANLVTARKYGWKIASFDAFYPKDIRLAA